MIISRAVTTGYLSRGKKWSWLYKGDLLAMLTGSLSRQKKAYLDFVAKGESEEIERFYSLKDLPSIMGGDTFKDMIRDKFSSFLNRDEIPEAKVLVPKVERVTCELRTGKKMAKTWKRLGRA